jgi:hypothetical protein
MMSHYSKPEKEVRPIMRNTLLYLLITACIIFTNTVVAQDDQTSSFSQDDLVSILLTDGTEIIGTIQEHTAESTKLKTPAGLTIEIPATAVVKMDLFEGQVVGGKVRRPDPNYSIYLFSPSAFPLGKGKKYCRDFCVVFPSYNIGFSNTMSGQAGVLWFPGVDVDETPFVASLKNTFYLKDKTALAGGIMYLSIPGLDLTSGVGFLFLTGTYGDRFNHFSLSLGWGYAKVEEDFEIMDTPILVLAGNQRLSNNIAFITENWFIPGDFDNLLFLSGSIRFIGKRIAVDIGAGFPLTEEIDELFLFPIVNFTYHF